MPRAEQLDALHDFARHPNERLNFYRDLFLHSADPTACLNSQGHYVEHNDAHRRLLGYSIEELRDKTLALDLGSEACARIETALAASDSFRGEVTVRDRFGQNRSVDLAILTIRDEAGLFVGRIAIKRDRSPGKTRTSARSSRRLAQPASQHAFAEMGPQPRSAKPQANALTCVQEYSSALAGLTTAAQVLRIGIEHAARILHAVAAAVVLPVRAGRAWQVACSIGYFSEDWQHPILHPQGPMHGVVFGGTPLFLSSLTDLAARYPHVPFNATLGQGAWATVPLSANGRVLGAFVFSFERPASIPENDRTLMLILAQHCAQALEHARLRHAERSARIEAERAQHRLEFLAEASNVLVASLDPQTTVATLAQLAVPHIADWCAIDVLNPDDGSIRRLAIAHKDPQKIRLAHELERVYPMDLDAPRGLPSVLRTGRSEFYPRVTDAMLRSTAKDPRHLHMLRELGIKSAMIVPLIARGHTLGGLRLVNAESDRRFTLADLAFAEDLARRIALALDNARLYQESRQTAEELRHAKESAESANASKDQFLAVLSHELRTPLTPVLTAAAALQQQQDLPEEVRSAAQMIRRNVELQARLIDDLLDLTRIARGKLELNFSPLDVHDLLRQTIQICQQTIRDKGLFLWLDLQAQHTCVRADPARLQQILWNLTNNATKFTAPGGRITLRTRNVSVPHDTSSSNPLPALVIEISDTGIGIEPDSLPRLFHAFEQGERSITRRFGGLGLGLAITKALVDAHGGRLTAASAGRDQGSTFTVQLQTVPTTLLPQAPSPPADSPTCSMPPLLLRILLVEDHQDTAQVMARLLRSLGHEVQIAGGVAPALELAQALDFDLLISDIGLPDGSGLELMRRLRDSSSIRGIALSGFGMDVDLVKSREAGFAEHLIKPINFQRLEAVIARIASSPPVAVQ